MALLAFFLDMSAQAAAATLIVERKSVQFSLLSLVRLLSGLSMKHRFHRDLRLGYFRLFSQ
jgi:acyl-coenzyme A thioesterase PaaI-like protein